MEEKTKKVLKNKYLLVIFILFLAILGLSSNKSYASDENSEDAQYMYLSDIQWETTSPRKSYAGWGNITNDQTTEGKKLSLRVDDQTVEFDKGVFAHAKSEIYYDLTGYDYDYFTTYYGVSSLQGSSGSVKFYIYTSKDGTTWNLRTEESPEVLTASSTAKFVKIDIREEKYLRLYADPNGSNGNDHALYADAKLIKEGYNENVTKTVEEYDEEIKALYDGENIDENLELLILQRELVSRVGQYTLRQFVTASEENKETLDWLMNDRETLRLYLVGGKPCGTYLKSLQILGDMHRRYEDDWNTTEMSKYNSQIALKDVYRTMILACSLEHSGSVYFWIYGQELSTPNTRYEIYKKLYNNGLIECEIFETLTVEEMRWVVNTIIDDESIEWLNDYVRDNGGKTSPYNYINYTFGYNYGEDQYYDPENYEMWDQKYNLSEWNQTYQKGYPKLWIVFEEGSVCGGLSKTGSCIWGSYKGLPNTCVCQPAHCAYIMYSQLSDGSGVWNLGNDVSGWGLSGNTEHLNSRMMNDWQSIAGGWCAPYVLLAQAAQNEYETYEKAQIEMMLAKVYADDTRKTRRTIS